MLRFVITTSAFLTKASFGMTPPVSGTRAPAMPAAVGKNAGGATQNVADIILFIGNAIGAQLVAGLNDRMKVAIVDPMIKGMTNTEDESSLVRRLMNEFDTRSARAYNAVAKLIQFVVIASAILAVVFSSVAWFLYSKNPLDAEIQRYYLLCVIVLCVVTVTVALRPIPE